MENFKFGFDTKKDAVFTFLHMRETPADNWHFNLLRIFENGDAGQRTRLIKGFPFMGWVLAEWRNKGYQMFVEAELMNESQIKDKPQDISLVELFKKQVAYFNGDKQAAVKGVVSITGLDETKLRMQLGYLGVL